MSILSSLFGGGVAKPIEAVGGVLDQLFTSDDEKLDKKVLLTRLAQQPALAQVALNKIEAQHRSVFVAGWRPFIGWVCGSALAYTFIGYPLLEWGFAVWKPELTPPVLGGTDMLFELVLAMLGMAGWRSLDKIKGVSK